MDARRARTGRGGGRGSVTKLRPATKEKGMERWPQSSLSEGKGGGNDKGMQLWPPFPAPEGGKEDAVLALLRGKGGRQHQVKPRLHGRHAEEGKERPRYLRGRGGDPVGGGGWICSTA